MLMQIIDHYAVNTEKRCVRPLQQISLRWHADHVSLWCFQHTKLKIWLHGPGRTICQVIVMMSIKDDSRKQKKQKLMNSEWGCSLAMINCWYLVQKLNNIICTDYNNTVTTMIGCERDVDIKALLLKIPLGPISSSFKSHLTHNNENKQLTQISAEGTASADFSTFSHFNKESFSF